MSQIYLFADVDASQNSNQAYGPVDSQNFRVQSKHEITGTKPAIAVVGGHVLAVQDPNDSSKINLILKPNHNELSEIFGYKIAFMVYKGIKKESLVKDGTQDANGQYELKDKGENDLIDHLRDTNDDNNNANGTSYDPGSNMLGLHLTDDNSMDEEAIDWLFRYDDDFGPVDVKAGDTLGNFVHEDNNEPDCAFEIYLHRFIEDHPVQEARNFDNEVTADSNDPPAKKEQILNYLDPAAFYGEYCKDECTVVVKDENDNEDEYEGKDAIFNNILSRFENKDALYLDIRNDNFYSYNFYEQFDVDGNNLVLDFEGYDNKETNYGAGDNGPDWPIHIIRTGDVNGLDNHDNDDVELNIRLAPYMDKQNNGSDKESVDAKIFVANALANLEGDDIKFYKRWWRDGSDWFRDLIGKPVKNLLEVENWMNPFKIELEFIANGDNGDNGSLISGYTRIHYCRKRLSENFADSEFPKKGLLDNLFPLIREPKLRSDEQNRLFVTGFERFVAFDHQGDDASANIPYSFYGMFKFAYLFEQNNQGENRVLLFAFADEVYFMPHISEARDDNQEANKSAVFTDSQSLDYHFAFNLPGERINPVICSQDIEENSEAIPILRFEPGDFKLGEFNTVEDLPDFNLPTNYLAVYLTESEYNELLNEANNTMDRESHLPFLKLEQENFDENRHEFPTDNGHPPRFTHYYRLPIGIKGHDANGQYAEKDAGENELDFSGIGYSMDSRLRSFNQLVFSTPVAAQNEPDPNVLNNVSDHYFILPDEVFSESLSGYAEVLQLKEAIKELYAVMPNVISAFWSKYLHTYEEEQGLKTTIGLFRYYKDYEPEPNTPSQTVPIFGNDSQNQNDPFENDFPYKHTYNVVKSALKSISRGLHYSSLVPNANFEQDGENVQITGLYRQPPFDVFEQRPADFQNNTNTENVENVFNLLDIYMDLAQISNERQNQPSFALLEEELENFVHGILPNETPDRPSVLHYEPDNVLLESDFHQYFYLTFTQNDQGRYLYPEEIARNFEPRFNLTRNIPLIRDTAPRSMERLLAILQIVMDDFNNHESEGSVENGTIVTPDNVRFDPDSENILPQVWGAFIFYGDNINVPENNNHDLLQGSGYEDFNNVVDDNNVQNNFPISNSVNPALVPDDYKFYLIRIYWILKSLSMGNIHIVQVNELLNAGQRPFKFMDYFPSEENDFVRHFYSHLITAMNYEAVLQGYENDLSNIGSNDWRRLLYADIVGHELGHGITSLLNPSKYFAFSEVSRAHKKDEDILFPNYPYDSGGGHIRGSISGNLACSLHEKVMRKLSQRYQNALEDQSLLGSFHQNLYRLREHKRNFNHTYQEDNDGLPEGSLEENEGYCYNNLNPRSE